MQPEEIEWRKTPQVFVEEDLAGGRKRIIAISREYTHTCGTLKHNAQACICVVTYAALVLIPLELIEDMETSADRERYIADVCERMEGLVSGPDRFNYRKRELEEAMDVGDVRDLVPIT